MHDLMPWPALGGGVLIGLGASLLLVANGKIAGISGMIGGVLQRTRGDVAWRLVFLAGLAVAGVMARALAPERLQPSPSSLGVLAVAGLLVGFGTRLANGCTSGHGVCGISRFSVRSLAATLTFIASGAATVALVRALGGGQ